jgi:hypothetical protein
MSSSKVARNRRTARLLQIFRGNKHEFEMLKGVLCMDHGQDDETSRAIKRLFDNMMIATRLDELRGGAASRLSVREEVAPLGVEKGGE